MGITTELMYLLRILLATALGFLIGAERKHRSKEAGMRTHALVCAGSALIMVVSKYGFTDVANYDAAKMAAQVVTGIGFIGAGVILYKQRTIHGLTTAAGIWSAAGIGMAAGAGLYIIAVGGALIMLLIQCLLYLPFKFIRTPDRPIIKIVFKCSNDEDEQLKNIFGIKDFESCVIQKEEDAIFYTAFFVLPHEIEEHSLKSILQGNSFICSIEKNDIV